MDNHTQESKGQQQSNGEDQAALSKKVSNELRKFIFLTLPIGIFRSTPYFTGDFVLANPTLVKMFGYSDYKSFLELSIDEIYWNSSDRKRLTDELLSRGEVRRKVFKFRKMDGQPFWGAVTAKTARDEHGQVLFFDGAIEDLSALREKEHQLKSERALTDTLLDIFPGQFWLNDEDGYCIRWNKNVEKVYGYNSEELKNFREAGGDDASESAAAGLKKTTEDLLAAGSGDVVGSGVARTFTINNREYLACMEFDRSIVTGIEQKLEQALEENRRLKSRKKPASRDKRTLQQVESDHILKILKQADWVIEGKSGAAIILGLNPSTLRGRMRKLEIQRPKKVTGK
ncbi:MAG: PAS domain S-box protein [Deltaproteobacteria bacterium]|nr:PAS domain S-box protein [Deltaproteobacteria bacterium]